MKFAKVPRLAGLAATPALALSLVSSPAAWSASAPAATPAAPPADSLAAVKPDPANIKFFLPADIPWTGTPGRSQQYYISGAADQPGPYVMLLKWWPNNFSQPHMHEHDRFITVISGTWWNSSSPVFDPTKTYPMPAGTVIIHEGGKVHWDGAKNEPTVLMIAGQGPATSTRVDANGNAVPRAAGARE